MANGRSLEQAEKQIAALIEENKRLSAELDELQSTGRVLEKATSDALKAQAAAKESAASSAEQLVRARTQVTDLQKSNATLTTQVKRLVKQVDKTPLSPLTVNEAAGLFDGLLTAFGSSKSLELRSATLDLKLASGKLDDVPVVLVPEPNSVDPNLLHVVRFDLTARPASAPIASPLVRPLTGPGPGFIADKAPPAPARKRKTPAKKR